MSAKKDIKVKELRYKPHDGIDFGELDIELSGKDMNISLVNSFRRTCEKNIPNLAFPRGLINIIKNTVIAYDNDAMCQRLRYLPIFDNGLNLDPKLHYLHERYWKGLEDEDYSEMTRPVHSNEKKVEILIDATNDTKDIMIVDTNHPGFQVFVDNIKVDMYNKKWPCLIIRMRPGESFICSMRATLGTGDEKGRNQWNSCTNSCHHYEGQKEIPATVCLRASGMYDPYTIAIRACDYLMQRTELVKKIILEKADEVGKLNELYEISLENEDSTIGELLNIEFQKVPDLVSGVMIPDRLVKSVTLKQEMFSEPSAKKFKKITEKVFTTVQEKLVALQNALIESAPIKVAKIAKVGTDSKKKGGSKSKSKKKEKKSKKKSKKKSSQKGGYNTDSAENEELEVISDHSGDEDDGDSDIDRDSDN